MRLLYKYMSCPNVFLEDGYVRATQLSALNDPFEASYCEKGLRELSAHFEIYEEGEKLISFINENKHKVGVISFTEAKDNLLMWSHYANEHKGAVVGVYTDFGLKFSMFRNLFKPPMSSALFFDGFEVFTGKCLPVMYRKQPRYRVDRYDFDYSNIIAEGADRILFEIFQQKSDEWIYEKEHRVTLRLEQADKVVLENINEIENKKILTSIKNSDFYECKFENKHVIYLEKVDDEIEREVYASCLANLSKNPNNLYLFKVDSSAICSLLIGRRGSTVTKTVCTDYAQKTGYFEIWNASLNESFYTLEFVKT